MSIVLDDDYASFAQARQAPFLSGRAKRLIVAGIGCAVMAMSGAGMAGYLDTSSVTANASSDTAPLDLN